jgi:Entner-Doudoroff aldolase
MSFSDDWFDVAFAQTRAMIILRGLGAERSLEIATSAWDAGFTLLELPIQTPDDVAALAAVSAAGRERGVPVGAGTVIDVAQIEVARQNGAAFAVSPGTDDAVVRASLDAQLPILPGVATASEVQHATGLGLGWFKAFPAASLGPGWIHAMHGPFPAARFVVTGGVDLTNASAFLEAGARVVAFGSAVTSSPEFLADASAFARS